MERIKVHYYKFLNAYIKFLIIVKIKDGHKKPITRKKIEEVVVTEIAGLISLLIAILLFFISLRIIIDVKIGIEKFPVIIGGVAILLVYSSFCVSLYYILKKNMFSSRQKELIYSIGRIEGKKQYIFYKKLNALFILFLGSLIILVVALGLNWIKPFF